MSHDYEEFPGLRDAAESTALAVVSNDANNFRFDDIANALEDFGKLILRKARDMSPDTEYDQ